MTLEKLLLHRQLFDLSGLRYRFRRQESGSLCVEVGERGSTVYSAQSATETPSEILKFAVHESNKSWP